MAERKGQTEFKVPTKEEFMASLRGRADASDAKHAEQMEEFKNEAAKLQAEAEAKAKAARVRVKETCGPLAGSVTNEMDELIRDLD